MSKIILFFLTNFRIELVLQNAQNILRLILIVILHKLVNITAVVNKNNLKHYHYLKLVDWIFEIHDLKIILRNHSYLSITIAKFT